MRERVASLQAAGRPVELGGYLAKPDAEAAIVRADWVLIPSRIESIPVVFSDAIKLGRPVVAMPVGDLPSLIAQGTGTLAQSVNAAKYADAIRTGLATRVESTRLREMAERFSLQGMVSMLLTDVSGHA